MTSRYRVFAVHRNTAMPFLGTFLPVIDAAPSTPPGACGWNCVTPPTTPLEGRPFDPVEAFPDRPSTQLTAITTADYASCVIRLVECHSDAVGKHSKPSDTPSVGGPSVGVMVTLITGVWTGGNHCLSSGPMHLLKRVSARGQHTAPCLRCRMRPDARAGARQTPSVPIWSSHTRADIPSGRHHTQRPRRGPVRCRGP